MCLSHTISVQCAFCMENIEVCRENCDKVIRYKEKNQAFKYFHSECFIQYVHNKIASARRGIIKEKWEAIISTENLEQLKTDTKNFLINEKIPKDELYHFLIESYHLTVFPKPFFLKLNEVYTGTYKTLLEPITPEDLLCMWKQKISYLDKVAKQQMLKGMVFDTEYSRLCWDLGCLVSRYDRYKKWKAEQELLCIEQQLEIEKNQHDNEVNKAIHLQEKAFSKRNKKEIDEEWEYNHRFDGLTLEEMIDKYW